MGRPNRDRTKTTTYLGPIDRDRVQRLRAENGLATSSAAIRLALDLATREEPEQADTVRVGYEILAWAERLEFLSVRERRELRDLAARLYRMT